MVFIIENKVRGPKFKKTLCYLKTPLKFPEPCSTEKKKKKKIKKVVILLVPTFSVFL